MAVQYKFNAKSLRIPAPMPPAEPVKHPEKEAMLRYFLTRHIELPKSRDPEVSIVIPVFNQYLYTIACLQSLVRACRGKTTYEVILADDGSTDETRQIADHVENLRIIPNTTGAHGFLPNVNFASRSIRGKYFFLLNNDTLLLGEDGLLDRMVANMEHEDVGAVGCRLLRPDGTVYDCGRMVLSSGHLMNAFPTPAMSCRGQLESDIVEGSAMMVRADAWRELGGFDPVFGRGYFEESDFCLKLKTLKKQRVITELSCAIIHFGQCSFKPNSESNQLFYQNARIFMNRWCDFLVEREAGIPVADPATRAGLLWKKLYYQR